jgi:hypothetical protein
LDKLQVRLVYNGNICLVYIPTALLTEINLRLGLGDGEESTTKEQCLIMRQKVKFAISFPEHWRGAGIGSGGLERIAVQHLSGPKR